MTRKGSFIVIEGLDGSGKTTQAKLLAKKLGKNHEALFTAEPSHGKTGTFIRNKILYGEKRSPTAMEALLFAADRIEHIADEVSPKLEKGHLVICDRYVYSSLAYQGSAGLDLDWIHEINKYALKPDFALFIDVGPEVVLGRLKRKKSVMENLATQQKVRAIYLKFVDAGELKLINGDRSKAEVAKEVFDLVSTFLQTRS
jgi:dTMP kinase